jgi:hypothetical protein
MTDDIGGSAGSGQSATLQPLFPRGTRRNLAFLLIEGLLVRIIFLPVYAYLPSNAFDTISRKRWMQGIHLDSILNDIRSPSGEDNSPGTVINFYIRRSPFD